MPRLGALSIPIPAPEPAEVDRRIRALGADLVVLPEACFPGYAHVATNTIHVATQIQSLAVIGALDGIGSASGVQTSCGFVWYRKRFLAPAEARVWQPGTTAVVADTAAGRVGLLICADVLQPRAWEDLRGRVDLVAVCAAWPHYRDRRAPPGLGWLYRTSTRYRDETLARCARSLGVPVALANAAGPSFDGECRIWSATGELVASGTSAVADVGPGTPGPPVRHHGRWAAFIPAYRLAGALTPRRRTQ